MHTVCFRTNHHHSRYALNMKKAEKVRYNHEQLPALPMSEAAVISAEAPCRPIP